MAPIAGYWGQPTATLDWCEENYIVTPYIAEFWNTLSNLAMIVPAFSGLYFAYKTQLERRFMLCFISLALVGFGSWNFHMTLLYEMQLFDELPMLWGSLMLVYALVTHLYETMERSVMANALLKLSLVAYGVICTFIYLSLKTPILFQVAYGVLVTLMLYYDIAVVRRKACSVRIFYSAIFFYYTGFGLWCVDNFACEWLRGLRTSGALPPLLAPITQLHAWWHLCAGYGAYLHILFCAHSRGLYREAKDATAVPLTVRFTWYTGIVLDRADGSRPPEVGSSKLPLKKNKEL